MYFLLFFPCWVRCLKPVFKDEILYIETISVSIKSLKILYLIEKK